MDTGNLLQTVGLLVCIGAVVLIALVAFASRAMSRRNNPQEPTVWNTRGEERPRYDEPDIETRGGFGGVPNTGDNEFDRDRNPPIGDRERASSGDRLVDYNRDRGREDDDAPRRNAGGFGGQRTNPPSQPRRDRVDDDDVRSSGGFGGG